MRGSGNAFILDMIENTRDEVEYVSQYAQRPGAY